MANFLINSAAVSVTGTEERDLFQVLSGASAVTVAGLGADDTFTFSSDAAATPFTFGKSIVQGGDGGDTINLFTAVSLSATSIGGGEGRDTITFGDTNEEAAYNAFTVNGGQGVDTLNFNAAITGTASAFVINGGRDDDAISIFSATGQVLKSGLIAGGKDVDVISAGEGGIYNLVTVNGGLGQDEIYLSATAVSGLLINGGQNGVTDASVDSADEIILDVVTDANGTILGNGGGDDISASIGGLATGFSIGGGEGQDLIDISATTASGVTVGGGKGNDTITILTDSLQSGGNIIIGGNGNDTVAISDVLSANNTLSIQGGEGADTIFGGFDVSATNLKYEAFSESNLDNLDIVDFSDPADTVVNSFISPGVGVATASAYVIDGETARVTTGTRVVDTFASAGITNVTAAVQFLDKALSTNEATVFRLNNADDTAYLFVQGGDTDLVVQYDNIAVWTAGSAGSASFIASSIAGSTKLELTLNT